MRILAVAMFCTVVAAAPAAAQAEGKAIFEGKGNCHVCHGKDALGTVLAPSLADSVWLNIDGSREAVVALIRTGVPEPVEHAAAMPPMGGAALTPVEVEALADYILSLSKRTDGD